jgi:hypothetical protein
MKRRLLRRSIWWLLPIVLARSLVPSGFMLAAADGGLDIVMCSGFGPVSHQMASAHQHHGGDGSDDRADDAPCLYAVSGSPCPSVAWTHETAPPPSASKIDFCSQVTRSCEPPLLDRIRGPPLA